MRTNVKHGLFVFGTLCDRDVLTCVLGASALAIDYRRAELPGYVVAKLPDESYPVLLPRAGGQAVGNVIAPLDTSMLDRLVFFEGDEYCLDTCTVRYENGQSDSVLFFAAHEVMPGATDPWSLEVWQTSHKDDFIARVGRFMAYYDTRERDAAEAMWETKEWGNGR